MEFKSPKLSFISLSSRQQVYLLITATVVVFSLLIWQQQQIQQSRQQSQHLRQSQQQHLDHATIASLNQLAANEKVEKLQQSLSQATNSAQLQAYNSINQLYDQVKTKITRNQDAKLDTATYQKKLSDIGQLVLDKKLDKTKLELQSIIKSLDGQWAKLQSAQAKAAAESAQKAAPAKPSSSAPAAGTTNTITTARGTFTYSMLKHPLTQINVKTVSASNKDCQDTSCNAKPLADYVKELGGFAGMNGTYFCPPDYSGCTSQKYGYNFPVYNSPTGTWLNYGTLAWNNRGLVTFNRHTPTFYYESKQFSGGPVTAAIGNSPTMLVRNGTININGLETPMTYKGLRGALGASSSHLYLVVIRNASVLDAAHVMKALGATNAINVDGGRSSALYQDNRYLVGPGRLLPNAIVLTR